MALADSRRQFDDAEPSVESDDGARLRRDDGRTRLCAATREALEPRALIRFVADPAGHIVPDLQRRLPGRGVWIKADKATIAQAVRANVFARSLKRQVKADPALAEQVERLIEKRVLEALALANKAGLVTTGFQQVDELVESGAAAILVQGADAAEGGREKLARKLAAVARANGRQPAMLTSLSTAQLSLAMGRSNVVHAALIQGGAAERFMEQAERLQRYRSGAVAPSEPESPHDLEV